MPNSLRRRLFWLKPSRWPALFKHLWYRRHFTSLGGVPTLIGWPDVSNDGELHLGQGCTLISQIHKVSLGVYEGATLRLGHNVVINNGTIISARVGITIGEGTGIGYHCLLMDSDHHPIAPGLPINEGPIVIGKHVWLASKVTVLQGVTIGDFAVVAAGAVVTQDVPPYAVVGGVPARVLRYIDRDITWRFHPPVENLNEP